MLSPQFLKNRKPELICGFVCLLVLTALAKTLVSRKLYIESENALLQGYAIALSSEVDGEVTRVFVKENDSVKKGQLLCMLEDSKWRSRLSAAEGARDALREKWLIAKKDRFRAEKLYRDRSISPQVHDEAITQERSLDSQLQAAQALVTRAKADLERTRILAPADGRIAFRTARQGMLAEPGTPLFGFVDQKDRWVLARVRETDLPDMHVGKPVDVTFDAAPGERFHGKIETISPASERGFYAAIPEDFSAGNYTKYVQWHPIRIRVALNDQERERFPVGISSQIKMTRD